MSTVKMLVEWLSEVDPSWEEFLDIQHDHLSEIAKSVSEESNIVLPKPHQVLRCLEMPISSVRVLIVGQDPYPTRGHACGLAFALDDLSLPLPKSLQNIKQELISDLNCVDAGRFDLTKWQSQGVMLLNRVLTVRVGASNSHAHLGWLNFTEALIKYVDSKQKIVAILWGNSAQDIEKYLANALVIKSAHPSPLAAHRGFFGSKPFSSANDLLFQIGLEPVDWCEAFVNA